MSRRRDYRLIARELAGLATDDEKARLQAWIAADPENRRTWNVVREAWRLSDERAGRSSYDADADWPAVRARLDQLGATAEPPAPRRTHARPSPATQSWTRRAAIGAAALAAGLLITWSVSRLVWPGNSKPAVAEVMAARGTTKEAILPDGSHVRLGAESSIRYAAAFDEPTREVELQGMAYFDVVHDPARPFIVHVQNGISTRVLGTRFVVFAYPETPRVQVAVAEGRVALRSGGPAPAEVTIGAGEAGQIGGDAAPTVAKDTSVDAHFAWMRGVLVLKDRPLAEALVQLERWYDAPLKVEDPHLASRLISTTAGSVPLQNVLENITLALGARSVVRGDTTVIVP
ncbi:MAG TPA: FecR domain-containing protein [Gemmatimonadaceae bacterium]|nr:FecR domain-containing protein [Gemmatimonadaceae bacterium]